MTKQEILDKLISHYEKCIREIEGMNEAGFLNIKRYVYDKHIQYGICNCALHILKESIVDQEWVNRNNISGGKYWTKNTISLQLWMEKYIKKSDIIGSLQTRVNIMKKEYQIPE